MKKAVKIIIIAVVAVAVITAGVLVYVNQLNASRYIGKDAAMSIAAKEAGVSQSGARFEDVDLDRKSGMVYYDVEMVSGSIKYEYKIDAATGNVLLSGSESVFD